MSARFYRLHSNPYQRADKFGEEIKMRIAQLTLDGYENYGQVLQRYALQRVLKNFADFVEVLWHQKGKNFLPYNLEWSRSSVGNLKNEVFKGVRQNKIKEFNDAYIRTRFDVPYLDDIADEYDFFVVGSDQVWNPEKYFPERFLEFAPREKRIAYAASFGVSELPENVKGTYSKKISEIPHVSLRELEGCDLVEKLTGKRPLHVLDPVFLLTANEWREIAKRPNWLNQKKYERGYLLTYFFKGKPTEESKTLANKLGLPMVNLYDLNNFDHYTAGIEEFLYLFSHATCIFTQSFHGTAFAVIFKRPFVVREMLESTNSRIKSLLKFFGLEDRTNLPEEPLMIDFSRRDEVLAHERVKALKFLSEALTVESREKILGGDAK